MRNYYKKGTDAQIYAEGLSTAIDKISERADEACDAIEYLENEVDDKQVEIDDMQEEIDGLEARLKACAPEEFLRVLMNIRLYVNDAIGNLEKALGQTQDTDSGDRDRSDGGPEDLGNKTS